MCLCLCCVSDLIKTSSIDQWLPPPDSLDLVHQRKGMVIIPKRWGVRNMGVLWVLVCCAYPPKKHESKALDLRKPTHTIEGSNKSKHVGLGLCKHSELCSVVWVKFTLCLEVPSKPHKHVCIYFEILYFARGKTFLGPRKNSAGCHDAGLFYDTLTSKC